MMDRKSGRITVRIVWAAVALAVTPLMVFSQTTQEVLQNLASQIAERRARVERLSEDVSRTREEYSERARSLSGQIADVEIQINREELRLQQIEQDIERVRETIALAQGAVTDVEPIVRTALRQYDAYVRTALPFQLEGRLAEIEEYERLLDERSVEPRLVLTRLWNSVVSEFRLTEESGLFRQTIALDGEEQLAEVARLGMVILYFRTFDGRHGYAVPEGDGTWRYELAQTRDQSQMIEELYEAFRRNLREGFFSLPDPYYGGVR